MNSELESACWEVRSFLYTMRISGILEGKTAEQVARFEKELLRFAMDQRSHGERHGCRLGMRLERDRWMKRLNKVSLS